MRRSQVVDGVRGLRINNGTGKSGTGAGGLELLQLDSTRRDKGPDR